MKSPWILLVSIFAALAIAGCGGGGGGGGGAVISGNTGVFLTDDLHNGYDSVWVRIHRIELLTAAGSATVYSDTVGRVVDVRKLNDGNELYAFLGKGTVADGTYTGVRVTLGAAVMLLPTGQTNGLNRTFAGLNANNQKVLTKTYSAPKNFGAGDDDFVIDFKLQNWVDDGTFIQNAEIDDGSTANLGNPDRHEPDEFKGTVASLTGTVPNLSFILTTNFGVKINVETNAQTAIYNNNGASNPVLQNGTKVEVHGKFVPAENAVVAIFVKIKIENDDDEDEVHGAPSNANLGAGTFDVEIEEAEGFIPTGASLTVQVNATTRYFGRSGVSITKEQFFDALATVGEVEAEGTYSSGSNILAATKVKLEDGEDDDAEAQGTASDLNEPAGTFTLTVVSWYGFPGSSGMVLAVTTDGDTEFLSDDNIILTKTQFFTQLAASATRRVEVEGNFTGSGIVAEKVKLEDPLQQEDEARGVVGSINGGAFSFQMSLIEWFGFTASAGETITIATTAQTEFRDLNGDPTSRAAFFAGLVSGAVVDVDGVFASGTLTARKVKYHE